MNMNVHVCCQLLVSHANFQFKPSKKEAPACSASWARFEALRALRPALEAAPSLGPGDFGVNRLPLLALGMDVVGISTFSEGLSCRQDPSIFLFNLKHSRWLSMSLY